MAGGTSSKTKAGPQTAFQRLREKIEKSDLSIEGKADLLMEVSSTETEFEKVAVDCEEYRVKSEDSDYKIKTITQYYEEILETEREQKTLDPKTGCLKEEFFWEKIVIPILSRVEHREDRRRGWSALFYIDLANFKQINDNLGHDIGDEVLRRFGPLLKANVRYEQRADYPARIGGDEFGVLMTHVDHISAWETAKRIREGFNKIDWSSIHPLLMSKYRTHADIGIACLRMSSLYDEDNETDERKLKYDVRPGSKEFNVQEVKALWGRAAEQLMYRSKSTRGAENFLKCYDLDAGTKTLVEFSPKNEIVVDQERRHQ
jgi:diguanylate cyclase (GGDEF)-like protein